MEAAVLTRMLSRVWVWVLVSVLFTLGRRRSEQALGEGTLHMHSCVNGPWRELRWGYIKVT